MLLGRYLHWMMHNEPAGRIYPLKFLKRNQKYGVSPKRLKGWVPSCLYFCQIQTATYPPFTRDTYETDLEKKYGRFGSCMRNSGRLRFRVNHWDTVVDLQGMDSGAESGTSKLYSSVLGQGQGVGGMLMY